MKGDGKHAAKELPFKHSDMDSMEEAGRARPLYVNGDEYIQDRIAAAVDALPERERFVFERHEYERLSFRQIAAMMSLSDKMVRNIHAKACERLRDALESLVHEED